MEQGACARAPARGVRERRAKRLGPLLARARSLTPCARAATQAENKFKCPCHGSQYNDEGKVIRGPAPLVRAPSSVRFCAQRAVRRKSPTPPYPLLLAAQSLALAHMSVSDDDTVLFSPWTETDFRCVAACACSSGAAALACPDASRPRARSTRSTGLAPWWK